MEANDIFSACLTDLFSLYGVDDTNENRINGREVLVKHFGVNIDEQVLELELELSFRRNQLEQELTLRKEQVEMEVTRERTRIAAEKERAERDIYSRADDVDRRELELNARERQLQRQETEYSTLEETLKERVKAQLEEELSGKAEQIEFEAGRLRDRIKAITTKEAELRSLEQKLSKKARDRDTKPGVVYEFRHPLTHMAVYVGRTTRDDPEKRIEEHLDDALNNENDFRKWIYDLYHREHLLPEVAIVYETSGEPENRRVERQHINDLLRQGAQLFNIQRKVPQIVIRRELLMVEAASDQYE